MMQLIDENNAEQYLRATGRIAAGETVLIRPLAGGVSNLVLLVSRPDGQPLFVLKQARAQLRVAEPWFSSIERIWREVEVIGVCERVLAAPSPFPSQRDGQIVSLPRILFSDREHYLFAMTPAPEHQVWKQVLLDGHCDPAIASACGRLLGQLHASTWEHPHVARQLRDRTFFEQLRVDPYYRHVARHKPILAPVLESLIQSLAEHPRCLVHGDFSPKNILVYTGGLMLVDFEVGHYGDPAFDVGFFLSHLVLKAFRAGQQWWEYVRLAFSFWEHYAACVRWTVGSNEYDSLVHRGVWNFAACLLARVDGKSKVDYLDERTANRVRDGAMRMLAHVPRTWSETVASLLPYLNQR